jgi:hypothetical protein
MLYGPQAAPAQNGPNLYYFLKYYEIIDKYLKVVYFFKKYYRKIKFTASNEY